MSILNCDKCGAHIDTDYHPEAYDYGLNAATGEDRWWCPSCFPDYEDPESEISVLAYWKDEKR